MSLDPCTLSPLFSHLPQAIKQAKRVAPAWFPSLFTLSINLPPKIKENEKEDNQEEPLA
jgi:hypothetical protein